MKQYVYVTKMAEKTAKAAPKISAKAIAQIGAAFGHIAKATVKAPLAPTAPAKICAAVQPYDNGIVDKMRAEMLRQRTPKQ